MLRLEAHLFGEKGYQKKSTTKIYYWVLQKLQSHLHIIFELSIKLLYILGEHVMFSFEQIPNSKQNVSQASDILVMGQKITT